MTSVAATRCCEPEAEPKGQVSESGAIPDKGQARACESGALPGRLQEAARTRWSHLEELANGYHKFYDVCRVLPGADAELEPINVARLWLCGAARQTLANGLARLAGGKNFDGDGRCLELEGEAEQHRDDGVEHFGRKARNDRPARNARPRKLNRA